MTIIGRAMEQHVRQQLGIHLDQVVFEQLGEPWAWPMTVNGVQYDLADEDVVGPDCDDLIIIQRVSDGALFEIDMQVFVSPFRRRAPQ